MTDNFDEPYVHKLPDGPPPGQAPGVPLLDRAESSRLSHFMSTVKDNLDQPKFNEAMDEWLSWGNELAPELHSMTTSLSPPDADTTMKLRAEYSGAHHQVFGDHRLFHATQFSKGYTEHTRDGTTSLLAAGGAEPQKYLANHPFLPQLDIPIQPSSVVDPKYLNDPLDINKSSKPSGSSGLASPQFLGNEANLINERSIESSNAIENSVYISPGILGFSPYLGQSIGTVVLGSDTVHATGMSPLSAPVPFAEPNIYKYGNDTSFVKNGFYTPSHQKSAGEITGYSPTFLDCLERQNSVSSPILDRQAAVSDVHIGSSDLDDIVLSGSVPADGSENKHTRVGARSRRRPKTRSKDKTSFLLEQDGLRHQPRPRKISSSEDSAQPPLGLFEEPDLSSSSHQSAKPYKPSRQNLSSEQRRANHIGSEKQRRDTIQGLEDELRRIVPVLRCTVFSKAEILEEAAKWVESLVEGNRVLEARLDKSKT